jgi:integrase
MARRGKNIYKRKDGRWEARVIRGYDEHGKTTYAYFYGRTYKEVRGKAFAAPSSNKAVAPTPHDARADDCLFKSALDSWLRNSRIRLKESSYVKYVNLVNNHIKPILGEYTLTGITNTALNDFAGKILKSGRCNSESGLSEKTVKDIMTIIKASLRFAREEALLPNVNIHINLPREKSKEMRVLSKEEQAVFEKYLCADIDECKLGVLLCLYTGLRVGEICALKWSDISLPERILTISRTMQRVQTLDTATSAKTKVLITDPKSDSSIRTIPLPDCLLDMLAQFCSMHPTAYFLTGDTEKFVEPRTYQNRFKTYIVGSGIRDANFHSTRHTFATRCVEVGFEIKSLSEILGHANVNITLNKYVHPSFDLKRSNMNKLNYL